MSKKRKKNLRDKQARTGEGQGARRILGLCGKVVLIGASYKIYALGVGPASAQTPAIDPPQQSAGLAAGTGQTAMDPMDPSMGLQIVQVPDPGPPKCVGGCIGCTGNTGGGGGGGGDGSGGLVGAMLRAPLELLGGFIQSIDEANRQAAEEQRQAAAAQQQAAEAQRRAAEMQRQAELQRLKEIQDLDQKGADCYKRKDWANAIKFFQDALRRRPGDRGIQQHLQAAEAQALNEKGLEYFKNKNWGAAAKCFQLALGYDPSNTVMQKNLAEANKQSALQEQQAKAAADVLDGKGNVLGGGAPSADLDGSANTLGPLKDAVADRRLDGSENILVPRASAGASGGASADAAPASSGDFYWAPKRDPGAEPDAANRYVDPKTGELVDYHVGPVKVSGRPPTIEKMPRDQAIQFLKTQKEGLQAEIKANEDRLKTLDTIVANDPSKKEWAQDIRKLADKEQTALKAKVEKVEGDIKKVSDTVTWPGGESSTPGQKPPASGAPATPGVGDKPAPAAATGPADTEGKNP